MENLINYNLEIVKLLKEENYTREEVLMILEKALRNIAPEGVIVINQDELRAIKHQNRNESLNYFLDNF